LFGIVLFQFFPIFVIAALVSTYFFRKTGHILCRRVFERHAGHPGLWLQARLRTLPASKHHLPRDGPDDTGRPAFFPAVSVFFL
jgi:hypothetical protein